MESPASSPGPIPPLLHSQPGFWRWLVHLLLMAGYVLGIAALNFSHSHRLRVPPALGHSPRGLVIMCAIQLLIFGIFFGAAWLCSRAGKEALLLSWRPRKWVIPLGFGYALGVRIILAICAGIIVGTLIATRIVTMQDVEKFIGGNRPDVETLVDVHAMRQNPVYYWLTLTLASFVVAGWREELWRSAMLAGFSKCWPRLFSSQGGQIAAAAFTAIIFGLGHAGMGPLAILITALLGFAFGLLMILHRSIWPAVFAHGFFDAGTFAMLPWLMGLDRHL